MVEYHDGRWKTFAAGSAAPTFDGPCRYGLTEDGFVVRPEGRSEQYVYLSDLDRVVAQDYQILLDICGPGGQAPSRACLYFLGGYFGQFVADLREERRLQITTNLLFDTSGEAKDFACAYRLETPSGVAAEGPKARLALYRNGLVVFPDLEDPFGFAYSDLEDWQYDKAAFSITLSFDLGEKLTLKMMGTRFGEFDGDLGRRVEDMYERVGALLTPALPKSTSEGTVFRLARVMRRGRAASRSAIDGVAQGLWQALVKAAFAPPEERPAAEKAAAAGKAAAAAAVAGAAAAGGVAALIEAAALGAAAPEGESPDALAKAKAALEMRKTAFEYLCQRAKPENTYLGIREGEALAAAVQGGDAPDGEGEAAGVTAGQPAKKTPAPAKGQAASQAANQAAGMPAGDDGAAEGAEVRPLLWFVAAYPESNVMASEVLTETGQATYFFRIGETGQPSTAQAAQEVARLSRSLVALDFKRDVIRATDADLSQDKMLRYRIAVRKLSYLRDIRRKYLGRAIHTSEAAWRKQADALLSK